MRHEVDFVHREIELTMTEDEGHALLAAIDRLRSSALFSLTPNPEAAINNLVEAITQAHAKLNAPTACCGRVLPDNHPGCACALEHMERAAWLGVADAAEWAREQPTVDEHHIVLTNRIESARFDSARLAEHRRSVSEFEKENNQ